MVGFLLGGIERIETTEDITGGDYIHMGSRLPLAEFPYPADVFDRFRDTRIESLPRAIRRHDLLNIHKGPDEVYSLMVVSSKCDRHLWDSQTKVFETTISGLLLMSLPEPIKIKWK